MPFHDNNRLRRTVVQKRRCQLIWFVGLIADSAAFILVPWIVWRLLGRTVPFAVLPIMIFTLVLQRHLVRGLTFGAVR